MENRDNLLLLALALEKAREVEASKILYKKYIKTHQYINEYVDALGRSKVDREISQIDNIEAAIRYDRHLNNLEILKRRLSDYEYESLDKSISNDSEIIRKVNSY